MGVKLLRSECEMDEADAARVDPAYRGPRAARVDPAHNKPVKLHGACEDALSDLCENGKEPTEASLLRGSERAWLRTGSPAEYDSRADWPR